VKEGAAKGEEAAGDEGSGGKFIEDMVGIQGDLMCL
jgi:hypothetical protein